MTQRVFAVLLAAILLSILTGPAAAQNLARQGELCSTSEGAAAIAACTAYIEAGKQSGMDVSDAYFNRGIQFVHMGEYDRAISDYTVAIQMSPGFAYAYVNRGTAFVQKDDFDRAIEDYSTALQIMPEVPELFMNRGVAYFATRQFTKAKADFVHALSLEPRSADAVLWSHVASARSGIDDAAEFTREARGVPARAWPAPLVGFYLGRTTRSDVLAATVVSDEGTRRGRRCEAIFQFGEDALHRRAPADAKRFFTDAANSCPAKYAESNLSRAELKALP